MATRKTDWPSAWDGTPYILGIQILSLPLHPQRLLAREIGYKPVYAARTHNGGGTVYTREAAQAALTDAGLYEEAEARRLSLLTADEVRRRALRNGVLTMWQAGLLLGEYKRNSSRVNEVFPGLLNKNRTTVEHLHKYIRGLIGDDDDLPEV